MKPAVSVIIPVYNGAKFLPEAIANVEAQAYPNVEIILVDDGSTDNTAAVAASLGDRIRYIYQENQGPAAARNRGLRAAQGKFIAFLDVDDQWPVGKLHQQLEAFTANPHLEIVNGYVQMLQAVPEDSGTVTFQPCHQPVVSFNLGSAIFRRSVFDKVGRFDASQIHSEDVDWFMHARELGTEMVVIEAVTLLYRKHDSNLTRDRQANLKGFMQAVRKSIQRRQQAGKSAENLPQLQYLQKNGDITLKNPEIVTPLATATRPQPPISQS